MRVTVTVNREHRDLDVEPRTTLTSALRDGCGLTSPHRGCADGTCGACTVLVNGEAVRSCLMLAVQCAGTDVRTIEGLDAGHPAWSGPATASSVHCDRCAAGLIMLAAGTPQDDPARVRTLLASNICRHASDQA